MTVTPVPTTTRLRRLALLALAVLTIATGVALAPRSASALTPGAPRVLAPIGWDHSILVAWSVPDTGGKAPQLYQVERRIGDAPNPDKIFELQAGTMWMVDKGLTNGQPYKYRVRALNADGFSPWSGAEATTPKAGRTPLAPFGSGADYVKRQYQDLLGRQPSAAELQAGVATLANTPVDVFTTNLAHTPARVAERHPVIRLYFAFFERSPDLAGANHWINKRKAGTNLTQIASAFAASSEFENTYGKLTNQAFVQQVYVNVFGRQPDPAGLAYWTKKLDAKTATRGQVMVGFSESSEYAGKDGKVGKSTGRVEAADIWMAIMKAVPSKTAMATYYAPHIQLGGSQGSLAMLLMPTVGYPG
ncbi:MAG: DUF4214 domain-containing protein [Acidimicrobiales bacterium]